MSYVTIEVSARTDMVGSKSTRQERFDREDWEEMDEHERDKECMEIMFEIIEWDWKVIESK